jgi:hypothetical protein
MSLRGNRKAIKLTAKTVEEALANTCKVEYVLDKRRKLQSKRKKVEGTLATKSEGIARFEGGFKITQGGLPTLGKRY